VTSLTVRLAASGKRFAHCTVELDQLLEQCRVERKGDIAGGTFGQTYATFDLAARKARRDHLAHARLERAQLIGETELDVEVAMVDRAHLHAERAERELLAHHRVSGHTVDHHCSPPVGSFSMRKRR
jgi:hypothetical protein